MVVLPAPFGPTIAVVPRSKSNARRSYDLMLSSSTRVTCIGVNGFWILDFGLIRRRKLNSQSAASSLSSTPIQNLKSKIASSLLQFLLQLARQVPGRADGG